jgi:hypothetical protein
MRRTLCPDILIGLSGDRAADTGIPLYLSAVRMSAIRYNQ